MFFLGGLGNLFRQWLLKNQFQRSGPSMSIGMGLAITGGKNIQLRDKVNVRC